MTARIEITGDLIQTKASNKAYRTNKFWDRKQTEQAEHEQNAILYTEPPQGRTELDKQVKNLTDYLTSCTQKD